MSPPYATVKLPKKPFRTSSTTNGSRSFLPFWKGMTHKMVSIWAFVLIYKTLNKNLRICDTIYNELNPQGMRACWKFTPLSQERVNFPWVSFDLDEDDSSAG